MSKIRIINGMVYEPDEKTFRSGDVYVEDGLIAEKDPEGEYQKINAGGCMVMPGLIDFHVHYFEGGTENSVNPDSSAFPKGVATAIDGGSSGAANYEQFYRDVICKSKVRIKTYLNISSPGQITEQYPENLDARYFDEEKIRHLFQRYPQNLLGLKIRLSKGVAPREKADAVKSLERTLEIAEGLGCNVVVHLTNPAFEIEEIAYMLRPGDVMCHIFQNIGHSILDAKGKVRREIWRARERGILMDACNGKSNFNLDVAKRAVAQGFLPDIISSDDNQVTSYVQPMVSLPRVLSKYLAMGMKIEDILNAAILAPARLMGCEGELATMRAGSIADIGIFKMKEKEVVYYDYTEENQLIGNRILVPQMLIKDGRVVYRQTDFD